MNHRRPRTAAQSSALPSLAALLASGVAVHGCAAPDESSERQDRLSTHGNSAASAFEGHRVGDALREIGVGLGLLPASTAIDPDMHPAGAAPVTNPMPPMTSGGAVAQVQPQPPTPPVPPPYVHPSGGAIAVHPQPPPPVEVPHRTHR